MISWLLSSFRRQVTLFVFLFVFLTGTVSIYEFYSSEKKQLNGILISQVTQLAQSVSRSTSTDVFYKKYYDLSSTLINVIDNNKIAIKSAGSLFKIISIAIVDKENKIVGHSNPLKYPIGVKYTRIYEENKKEELNGVSFLWGDKKGFLSINKDITYGREVVGYVYIDIDPVFLSLSENTLKRNILVLMVLFFLAILFFSYSFGNWVDKPLLELIENIKNLGDGKVDFTFLKNRRDEFNALAKAMVEADKRIYAQNKELLDIQKNLEDRVEQRTQELTHKANELSLAMEDLKKYQKQMVEAEKMSALGSLVAGVSHEINTPIGVSLTGSTHIESETKNILYSLENEKLGKKALKEYLEMVEEMSRSMCVSLLNAANLVRSFKQVAIDQHIESKRHFNLRTYCDEVLLSLHNKLTHVDVIVKNEIDEDINVFTYAGIFSQIWTNFIINSLLHAFDENTHGNEIIISARFENNSLILIYRDNGKGIDEDNIEKIFEPFFTTKMGEGGSGLGLNIIYNLINHKLKGDIGCSNKDQGIEIIISIPEKELSNE